MSIVKSNDMKEFAAGIFLKWFTDPKQNLRFISSTGYLPVTNEAFNTVMSEESIIEDDNINKLIQTANKMYNEYLFYFPPTFDNLDELEKEYVENLKSTAYLCREEYLILLNTMNEDEAFIKASANSYSTFVNN